MENKLLRQIIMASKWTIYGVILQVLFLKLLMADVGKAQVNSILSVKEYRLKIEFKNEELVEVFNKIERKTGYHFAYEYDKLDQQFKFDNKYEQKNVLADVLIDIAKETGLKFKQINNTIIVITDEKGNIKEQIEVANQTRTITGQVTSEDTPEGLPGVNVILKGTPTGTVTDINGKYSLEVPVEDAILVFSSVGYVKEEVVVGSRTVIDMALLPNIEALEEVVVVGYGTMKRSDITGSVASVKTESLQKSVPRVDQAIQGRISGVMVQNQSASPRGGINIRIRGANSINGGNDPLVVIDGFQGGDLSTLNPNNIESIEVLKDASATAIYGSRGANGVILVATKSGQSGKPKVSYDNYLSIQQPRKTIDVLNAAQYAQVVNENRIELGQTPIFSDSEIAEFRNSGGTDWQEEILQNGFSQNHSLSVGGGSENISYFVSGGLVDTKGIVLNTSYKRYNLRSNISSQITDNLSFDLKAFFNHEEDHPTNQHSYGGANDGSPIYSALLFSPTKSVYDDEGNYTLPGGGVGPPTNSNPVALAKEPIRDHLYNTTNLNASASYKLTEGLVFKVSGGYLLSESKFNNYFNSKPSMAAGSEVASISNNQSTTLQNSNEISYEKSIGGVHDILLTGVYEQQVIQNNSVGTGSRGFFSDATSYNNLGLGDNISSPSSSTSKRTLQSYMARVNYSYKGKYMVTLTGRADASSVFGKNHKWGYFPSAAVGWNVSSEDFMTGVSDVINNFKIRTSYGITGNQAIGPYKSLGLLNTGSSYPMDGLTPSVAAQLGDLANPDLKWERTIQSDIGIDMQFFEGRIELIADYYSKKTKDLLLQVPLPAASGGSARVLRNIGEVENKGVELYIGGKPVDGAFSWETGFTFAKNRNEVVALKDDETMYPLGDAGLPGFTNSKWLEIGQPLGLYRGYVQDGVWKTSEADEAESYGAFPGAPKFVDQNGDNVIDSEDIVPIANAQPDFTYGWNNTLSLQNFDLNIFVQGVSGNDILNLARVRMEVTNGDADATSPAILDRWTAENGEKETNVPSFTGQNASPTLATSRWVENGSYLRVKYINLGYDLPSSVIQKLKIESARIYISGTNLITITDYSGFDPEASSNVDRNGGVDVAAYPAHKTYTIGINLRF